MKWRIGLSVMLFLLVSFCAFAQEAVTWDPEAPDPGDVITFVYDPDIGTLGTDATDVKFHWGINETSHGEWQQAPEEVWPEGSIGWWDGKGVQSPMTKNAENKWEITLTTLDTFRTIHFVFTDGSKWDSNNGSNWDIYLGGGGPGAVDHTYEAKVDVLVDLSTAIRERGFTYGDTLEARFGYFNTAKEVAAIPLVRQGISSYYSGSGDVTTTLGDTLDYSYFSTKNGDENWEVFYNFDYAGDNQSEAQRRQLFVKGKNNAVADTVHNSLSSHRPPFFRNLSVLAQDVLVTLVCDLRPAYYHLKMGGDPLGDIQGNVIVSDPDSVLILGLAVNGPITGSWSNDVGADWGVHLMELDNKVMFDDGTNGDAVAGDTLYSKQFQFYKDSSDVVGQEFKFGIGGGDNESGFGNNHVSNIDDFEDTATIEAQFGSIYPVFYSEWDYDTRSLKTGLESVELVPEEFVLQQNFPNPFNPRTRIKFSLGEASDVTLRIYNVLGEEITTLVDTHQPAGSYVVDWDGRDGFGRSVGSGIYFCRMQAGDMVRSHKMMLMK